jgi:hypothetical protein
MTNTIISVKEKCINVKELFRKNTRNAINWLASMAIVAGLLYVNSIIHASNPPTLLLEAPTTMALPDFIDILMDECSGGRHSPAKRTLLSKQIERAASTYLHGMDRHAFVALLCLETSMGSSKSNISTAGARGIGQLMPATGKAEAVRCGLGTITDDDLFDNEINLNIAACHYAELVRTVGPSIAPAAYNGGANSDAVKALQRLHPSANLESMGYQAVVGVILAKYLYNNVGKK